MIILDAAAVRRATPWLELVDAIEVEMGSPTSVSPERHVHGFEAADGSPASLLVMPAWTTSVEDGGLIGVKAVTYVPDNASRSLPTIHANYLAFDRASGVPVGLLDGDTLTARRTAAISALAARHLARPEPRRLLVIGTGQLAPVVAAAHVSVGQAGGAPTQVVFWGRRPVAAEAAARRAREAIEADGIRGVAVTAAADLAGAVAEADIIVCVTASTDPVLSGRWVAAGTHINLMGSFRPDMRESDDELVRRATLYVDSRTGALLSGDLSQPIDNGVLTAEAIAGDLAHLSSGSVRPRSEGEITVFKSVGFATADLVAARLALASTG